MPTLITNYYTEIIAIVLLCLLCFLAIIFMLKQQKKVINWGVFYATLYTLVALPIVNYCCVKQGLWSFEAPYDNSLHLPYDLYFIWVVVWAIVPVYFFKGKYRFLLFIAFFWVDILVMPLLQEVGVFTLHQNWLVGEIALLCLVFLPAYCWANASINNKLLELRALLQVLTMALIFLIGLPFVLNSYDLIEYSEINSSQFITQLFIIIVFPALVAVIDLVKKGKGTPFPYDKTQYLVQTGVYAYIRNPIQWSFTIMFLPLAMYYSSSYLLLGVLFSVAYTYGVSNYQEDVDMNERFGVSWSNYIQGVPKWYFLWKPNNIPVGTIYFNASCEQCNQIRQWFQRANVVNLEIRPSYQFPQKNILEVTYVDDLNNHYKSVEAIACALEHINLAYATLGWFMRFPVINFVLQAIVHSMNFGTPKQLCETGKTTLKN